MAKKEAAKKAPTKTEILTSIAEKTELSKKQVGSVLDALTDEIKKSLSNRGAGVFAIPGLVKIEKRLQVGRTDERRGQAGEHQDQGAPAQEPQELRLEVAAGGRARLVQARPPTLIPPHSIDGRLARERTLPRIRPALQIALHLEHNGSPISDAMVSSSIARTDACGRGTDPSRAATLGAPLPSFGRPQRGRPTPAHICFAGPNTPMVAIPGAKECRRLVCPFDCSAGRLPGERPGSAR